jgi:ketosteroid isomerase-like protein
MVRHHGRVTNHAAVSRWLAGYEAAWRAPGTHSLAALFTADASYLQSPYAQPVTGLDAIRHMWEDEIEGPDEVFTLTAYILAVDGETAVVQADLRYGDPPRQEYRDLWIIRLGDDGRCRWCGEWPSDGGHQAGPRPCGRLLTCIGFQLDKGLKPLPNCRVASTQRSFPKIATGV